MTLGEKLASARKRAGLTQERLADRIGVSFQAVSGWERNESLPDTAHLSTLAKALHLSLDQLFDDSVDRTWELKSPSFSPEHMYTYVKARAQAEGMAQTLAALPLARQKHAGQLRTSRTAQTPYIAHPLTLACHAMAMGILEDEVVATALLHDVVEDTGTPPEDLPVGDRVREAVCLLSYNTYLPARYADDPVKKKQIKPEYYRAIAGNPLAALVKCLDRCNNLSCMADGFSRRKMATYVTETETFVLPLLEVIKAVPAYNNAAWLLRYQMVTLLETLKRLL